MIPYMLNLTNNFFDDLDFNVKAMLKNIIVNNDSDKLVAVLSVGQKSLCYRCAGQQNWFVDWFEPFISKCSPVRWIV